MPPLNYRAIAIGVAVLTAFAFGRFSAPEKVKIETKTVTVETQKKETLDATKQVDDKNRRVETETTELVRPDGSKETRTKTVETTQDQSTRETEHADSETRESTRATEVSKEITSKTGRISIVVLGGFKLNDLTSGPRLGGYVGRNLLGPITVGVWGMNDLSGGIALGLSF